MYLIFNYSTYLYVFFYISFLCLEFWMWLKGWRRSSFLLQLDSKEGIDIPLDHNKWLLLWRVEERRKKSSYQKEGKGRKRRMRMVMRMVIGFFLFHFFPHNPTLPNLPLFHAHAQLFSFLQKKIDLTFHVFYIFKVFLWTKL